MSHPTPDRYESGRAMCLAGIRRRHSFGSAQQGPIAQWNEFRAREPIPGQVGTLAYGVLCGASSTDFEYMCGVEVTDFAGLPAHLGRMRVPAQHYAVFLHRGHQSTIQKTWEGILRHWLPHSGRKSAHTPDFEIYGEKFDFESSSGEVEIWVGVI